MTRTIEDALAPYKYEEKEIIHLLRQVADRLETKVFNRGKNGEEIPDNTEWCLGLTDTAALLKMLSDDLSARYEDTEDKEVFERNLGS